MSPAGDIPVILMRFLTRISEGVGRKTKGENSRGALRRRHDKRDDGVRKNSRRESSPGRRGGRGRAGVMVVGRGWSRVQGQARARRRSHSLSAPLPRRSTRAIRPTVLRLPPFGSAPAPVRHWPGSCPGSRLRAFLFFFSWRPSSNTNTVLSNSGSPG